LLAGLPAGLPAAVLVVLHRAVERESRLAEVLARRTRLRVVTAHEGDALTQGVCYVGTPAQHLTIDRDLRITLLRDGFYRGHSIDALFHSLARHAGPRTIGVVLSGLQKDGTLGLLAIKESGGVAFVQDPAEALYAEMPTSAIAADGQIDLVAPVSALAREIRRRVGAGRTGSDINSPLGNAVAG
jgi:two-component system chemotaxis response regulator CheB